MANKQFQQFVGGQSATSTPLAGTESIPIVQSSVTTKITPNTLFTQLPDTTTPNAALAFANQSNMGIAKRTSAILDFIVGGIARASVSATGLILTSAESFGWSNSNSDADSTSDAYISRAGTANIMLGQADAASPVAQTLSVQNVVAGNGNTAAANFSIQGGLSNGSGGGDLLLRTTQNSAGSGTQNSAATALTLKGGTQQAQFAGNIQPAAGTTALSPLTFQSGTNLTSAVAGGCEFDGVQFYETIDTTSGRGAVPVEQYFRLDANGGNISTIGNFFGTTSNISLVASARYFIVIDLYYTVTGGTPTVTWTLTNSAAPTSQNILFRMSPVAGMVAPPGTATMLEGQFQGDSTAARTIVTGTLAAATYYTRMEITLKNGTGTSLQIQATASTNSITPLLNSWWRCRRLSPNNIGTFAA